MQLHNGFTRDGKGIRVLLSAGLMNYDWDKQKVIGAIGEAVMFSSISLNPFALVNVMLHSNKQLGM